MAGHLAAIGLLLALLLGWLAVQRAWVRTCAGEGDDVDALAGRECAGTGCRAACGPRRCPRTAGQGGSR